MAPAVRWPPRPPEPRSAADGKPAGTHGRRSHAILPGHAHHFRVSLSPESIPGFAGRARRGPVQTDSRPTRHLPSAEGTVFPRPVSSTPPERECPGTGTRIPINASPDTTCPEIPRRSKSKAPSHGHAQSPYPKIDEDRRWAPTDRVQPATKTHASATPCRNASPAVGSAGTPRNSEAWGRGSGPMSRGWKWPMSRGPRLRGVRHV